MAPKKLANAAQVVIELRRHPVRRVRLFRLALIVPTIDKWSGGYGGNSLFAGIIILAMMILPTIISVSATSLKAVPEAYKDASLALGESTTGTSIASCCRQQDGRVHRDRLGIGAVDHGGDPGNGQHAPHARFFNKGLAALFRRPVR